VRRTAAGGEREVDLAYGRGRLRLRLPEGCRPTVIRQQPLPPLADPAGAVRAALQQPVGSAPLADLARGRSSACLVICDITRPVPNGLFLRPMIETIVAAGVPLERVTVLVATGLHRPNVGEELEELVGDRWVLDHVRVQNHDARDDQAHRWLGRTSTRSTPVAIDRRFAEADLKIVTGLVEPHFMAGWSGGRKVVAPGVAHHTTIRTFHSARFMEHPRAVQCVLDGNPLHEEQLEIVAMLGEVYGLDTVVDEERRLVHVGFGEVRANHAATVERVSEAIRVPVPRRFATVVTSAAGYPLDKTYYQTVKGMVTPLDILAPGGTLLIAAECSEGLGSAEFRAAQQRLVQLGPDDFLATLTAKSLADVDEWQTEMQLKPLRQGRVGLYSTGLPVADRGFTAVDVVDDLAAAVAASIARSGDPAVAVVPEGPYVVPYLAAAAGYAPSTPV
jgi:nickel-dependent lactate racemase